MPAQYQMIYLGKLADMDTNEKNDTAESPATSLGSRTYGSAGSPLFVNSTLVALNDDNGDGTVPFDHQGTTESISYVLNGTRMTAKLDSGVIVSNVTVTQAMNCDSAAAVRGRSSRCQ